MSELHRQKITSVFLEDEMKTSYLNYSMSVIVSRALPDIRDGLKPSQRRILVAMNDLGLAPGRPFRKCAKIAGDTSGNYHPHGEQVVYPTLVRMAQDFNMRYPLVDGQGNYGCFTGDTKIKLLDGTEKTFAELAELPPDEVFFVYSVDAEGQVVVGEGRHSRITRRNAELVEVVLDSGARIRCTPDHRFMLRDGTYKQAKDLTPDDSLMPGYFDRAPVKAGMNEYLRIQQPRTGEYEFVHHLADRYNEQRGLAQRPGGPFVRHHVNFNRFDNRPTNIRRMLFLEHLHLHASNLKTLWSDEAFREAQRAGARRYYDENPAAREKRSAHMRALNQDPELRRRHGARVSERMRRLFEERPELAGEISSRMKELWADPDYRARMSIALTGIEKRPLTPEQRARVGAIIAAKNRAAWGDPAQRAALTAAIRAALADPSVRGKISRNARRQWSDPSYRARFDREHFSSMAQQLWSLPATRALHQQKIARQWADPIFREAQAEGVKRSNARRIAATPGLMHALASKAAPSLRASWRSPAYREQVMRSKIARYGSELIAAVGVEGLSRDVFDGKRPGNWVPRFEKAMQYFGGFDGFVDAARTYNHRVIRVQACSARADVYDITVDQHHNFLLDAGVFVHNSIDGDAPAAMRYTEARLTPLAMEMLRDLEKNTVDTRPNYDETLQEPVILPSVVPNLLLNGASGIAVGMATEIPPHNLTEVADAIALLIDKPEATLDEIMQHMKGPDFPTGGIIYGFKGIRDCYETGRGLLRVRAKVSSEESRGGKMALVVTEIPFQVNKTNLLEKIADLVKEGKLTGISDLRDESDRDGMRIVIELKKDAQPKVVLNQLFVHTQLQSTFGAIMLSLVDGRPQTLPLRQMLVQYVEHRGIVVRRRTEFELAEAEKRAHILEGLKIAIDHLDEVIKLIRGSADTEAAREGLMKKFGLSEIQANAILDMRLGRLVALEREKIEAEYLEVIKLIEKLKSILANPKKIMAIIREEILELKKKYGDERRTEIVPEEGEISLEDLIKDEDMVVTISHAGYIKRNPVSLFRAQRRGGKGLIGAKTREEDFVEHLFVASTHAYLLFLTNRGRCYWLKVHEIDQAGRAAKGRPIVNLIEIQREERVTAVVPVKQFDDEHYLVMATHSGTIKKTVLSAYGNPRRAGIFAILLEEGDEMIEAAITDGSQDLILAKKHGKAIRFHEKEVRPMGRTAHGVKAVSLDEGDLVVSMVPVRRDATLLSITVNGYGKRSPVEDYRVSHRGGLGIITIKTSERNGEVVAVKEVVDVDQLMIMTSNGQVIRVPVKGISVMGRNTQGVRLIQLEEGDKVTDVARVVIEDEAAVGNGDVTMGGGAAPDGDQAPADESEEADAEE
ncbi:MAG: DNA gyrase subunit A [Candidatus Eiseniibacteriota bacterium]